MEAAIGTRMEGTALAKRMMEQSRAKVLALKDRAGIPATLAVILVGDDPASHAYVRSTVKKCEQYAVAVGRHDLARESPTAELLKLLHALAADAKVHGIMLQHPLPLQIDSRAAFEAIPGSKDVDGVSSVSLGRVTLGLPAFAPCTPAGIMRLLAEYQVPLSGTDAVVIGRSPIVGKPLAAMLTNADATVTLCHSKTRNLAEIVQRADLVCAAVGKPKFVQGAWIKPGAVVVDAGYHEGGVGDVDFEGALANARLITPVPGGVGPMTVAVLMEHTVQAARSAYGIS